MLPPCSIRGSDSVLPILVFVSKFMGWVASHALHLACATAACMHECSALTVCCVLAWQCARGIARSAYICSALPVRDVWVLDIKHITHAAHTALETPVCAWHCSTRQEERFPRHSAPYTQQRHPPTTTATHHCPHTGRFCMDIFTYSLVCLHC